ncbi:ATPase AAA [Spirochaetia bacterium]|nr:ATPase AAA [Spirochaetia bacterium]
MRPRTLEDIVGQGHIVGPGRLLRRAIQADRLSSLIFYGPPGTGKTSLARVIANTTRAAFESLNAVLSGIKDIREAIDRSDERRRLYGKRTILFVDEVHRWNKAQQDALLPWVENGTVILVGATTENPFFEVNRALVSRSRVFQLKPLGAEDLKETARRTLADKERGYGKWQVNFEEGALDHLVEVAGGDARSLLNALELAIETSIPPESGAPAAAAAEAAARAVPHWPPPEGAEIRVSMEAAEESIQRRALLYDRDGDYHFDTISAFIKSVRGSDPDGSLYWLAKMIRAGEDPSFIFRRMIILASEDVGLADPHALGVVISCAEAFDRIGFPEGNFPLIHACLYLATAPKSNTTMNFFDVMKEVEKEDAEVPNHLRDASRDGESFGHGEGYVYPHAYRDHWAAQQYLPSALMGKIFYMPSRMGYEGKIREEVLRKRELQAAIILGASGDGANLAAADAEVLTWSAVSKGREGWFKRLESGRSSLLLSDREAILGQSPIRGHDRILIAAANDGLLLWESLRRSPEGLTAALVDNDAARDTLLGYATTLDEIEQPQIALCPTGMLPDPARAEEWFSTAAFDHIFARDPWRRILSGAVPGGANGGKASASGKNGGAKNAGINPAESFRTFAGQARQLLAPGGDLVLLQSPPRLGERISRILAAGAGGAKGPGPDASGAAGDTGKAAAGTDLIQKLREAEESFFTESSGPAAKGGLWTWDGDTLKAAFEDAGFTVTLTSLDQREERLITERDLSAWFDQDHSRWGAFIGKALGKKDFARAEELMRERIKQGPVVWQWKSILLKAN